LNPTIDAAIGSGPYKPIAAQKEFFSRRVLEQGKLNTDGASIARCLSGEGDTAALIYLYCHGDASSLDVDMGVTISPSSLNPNIKYKSHSLIVMNSCSSGAASPLDLTAFLAAFVKKNADGMIGTASPVPATFAACLGQRLLDAHIDGSSPVVCLHGLRRSLLMDGNPLGLFYSVQCPLDWSRT
jgi:hypothetical protein